MDAAAVETEEVEARFGFKLFRNELGNGLHTSQEDPSSSAGSVISSILLITFENCLSLLLKLDSSMPRKILSPWYLRGNFP